MKNYKTVFSDLWSFYSFECSNDIFDEDEVSINISIKSNKENLKDSFIQLDIDTAVKLTKVLKAEIYQAKNKQEQLRNAEALKNQTKLF